MLNQTQQQTHKRKKKKTKKLLGRLMSHNVAQQRTCMHQERGNTGRSHVRRKKPLGQTKTKAKFIVAQQAQTKKERGGQK
jgi:hypothetical protein